MVPVIDPPTANLSKVLNYNEKKVQRGVAELLHAGNFLKPANELNFHDKLHRFKKLNELNERTKKSTLHISLNFHPDDHLTKEQLCEIAAMYMDRIGMGNQPYLVYQHHDSGHPHIHLVTSLIQSDGVRVRTNNMGKDQSVKARKEIDNLYSLRKVEDSQHSQVYEPEPVNAQKVAYGKLETKKAIKDVLRFVLKKYKFTSLPELNAVLQQYDVLADRGATDSRIFKNGGLIYRVLDEQGAKIGVPIKASDFHFKPTLKSLQEMFKKNVPLRKADISAIRSRIDWTLGKQPKSFQAWIEELRKENIRLVVRRNDQGVVYGLTYVDFKTRSVLNGSDLNSNDLGKVYSAQAIIQRFNVAGQAMPANRPPRKQASAEIKSPSAAKKSIPAKSAAPRKQPNVPAKEPPRIQPSKPGGVPQPLPPLLPATGQQDNSLLQDLLTDLPPDQLPYELTTELKKKKKKRMRQ
ncbi:MAG: hypothetical protein BGO55_20665 [Sphingobacteriales bacterium 50-39]|nr:relaxase/mobilization nuclease domain-containing protein [Sphingobacteriales bacterium]OJW59102.1 MAG: hypothetical protein BGO55_20665 [Sphingobacteriales bacterium 50-39]